MCCEQVQQLIRKEAQLLSAQWFHGFLSSDEADSRLLGAAPGMLLLLLLLLFELTDAGTFLVRFSSSKATYVLCYVNISGGVEQTRIITNTGNTISNCSCKLMTWITDGTVALETESQSRLEFTDLRELVRQEGRNLWYPCKKPSAGADSDELAQLSSDANAMNQVNAQEALLSILLKQGSITSWIFMFMDSHHFLQHHGVILHNTMICLALLMKRLSSILVRLFRQVFMFAYDARILISVRFPNARISAWGWIIWCSVSCRMARYTGMTLSYYLVLFMWQVAVKIMNVQPKDMKNPLLLDFKREVNILRYRVIYYFINPSVVMYATKMLCSSLVLVSIWANLELWLSCLKMDRCLMWYMLYVHC